MSGGLLYNYRQGNRSELLADYLLSAIGITTPVRRQDDIGIDFYCQLSDQEIGYLTFGFPFLIQIKSDSSKPIKYGKETAREWKFEHISWLFRNEVPFFIGIVNKDDISIKIYDTTGLWQVYNSVSSNWSQIELISTFHKSGEMRENCKEIKIDNWEDGHGDGVCYKIDMGNPIIEIKYSDLQDSQSLFNKKAILRRIIALEQQNIIHRNLGIRGFNEVKDNSSNEVTIVTGMAITTRVFEDVVSKIKDSFRVGLISLLCNLAAQGKDEECLALKNVLRYIPKADYYDQLYSQNPNLFDWTKELLVS